MEEKKKTNIVVLADQTEYGKSAVCCAASLAKVFKTSLTIVPFFCFGKRPDETPKVPSFDFVTQEYGASLEVSVEERWYNPDHLHHFAEQTNSIMYVIAVGRRRGDTYFSPRRAVRFIAPSRLPVMTVGRELPRDKQWLNVMVAVDPDRQSKEKALWAGYFNRYGNATVHILHTIYREKILRQKLDDGLEFVEKLYGNLEIRSEKHEIVPHQVDLEKYAIEHSQDYSASLLVVMTTKYRTWVDALLGPREQAWITNDRHLPILCINERDDLYVLCT